MIKPISDGVKNQLLTLTPAEKSSIESEIHAVVLDLKPQNLLSPTSINNYFKCPRRYYFDHIVKLKTKPSIHLIKGSMVHKVLEDFFKGTCPEDMISFASELFAKTLNANEKVISYLELNESELSIMKADCWNMINEYILYFQRQINAYITAEKAENAYHAWFLLKPKLRELFVKDETLHCCGYIDRVTKDFDGNITLGDYKTSNKFGQGLPDDYRRQLAIYSLLYYNQEKVLPEFVAVDFLRFGKEVILEVTPSTLRYARDAISHVYQKTRSICIDDYPLYESRLCKWCPYNEICSGQEDWEAIARQQKIRELVKKTPLIESDINGDKI